MGNDEMRRTDEQPHSNNELYGAFVGLSREVSGLDGKMKGLEGKLDTILISLNKPQEKKDYSGWANVALSGLLIIGAIIIYTQDHVSLTQEPIKGDITDLATATAVHDEDLDKLRLLPPAYLEFRKNYDLHQEELSDWQLRQDVQVDTNTIAIATLVERVDWLSRPGAIDQ